MNLEIGKPTLLYGNWNNVSGYAWECAELIEQKFGRVLFIDTVTLLTTPQSVQTIALQKHKHKDIYCLLVRRPLDFLSWLSDAEIFISRFKIQGMVINSLTLPFAYVDETQIVRQLHEICTKTALLMERHGMAGIFGLSPDQSVGGIRAFVFLKTQYELEGMWNAEFAEEQMV